MTRLDPISTLSQYSTSILSDALDELGIAGVIPGIEARRIGQGLVVGRALPDNSVPEGGSPFWLSAAGIAGISLWRRRRLFSSAK